MICSLRTARRGPQARWGDALITFCMVVGPIFTKKGYSFFLIHCAGQYRSELRRGILLARSKVKDPDAGRQLEIDIQGISHCGGIHYMDVYIHVLYMYIEL